ncbi:MAG: sigma-70 family RNA polymerase sigma factor [Candidatus Poribacteria bacterium]|nr:sigma-70 family RNA polymerase sigma factor [Candidatus Poribacteria bacterium]
MYTADEKLVSQTLAGDRDAFGVLVHKYQDMVYTYAYQKVRNAADSQDITQEVFLKAFRHLQKLRHPHLFRSWLYTIMSNECKRWLERVTNKRRREIALEQAVDDSLQIQPEHTVPTQGWQVDLEQAMSELPDESRLVVSMFYAGDYSLKEISEFLGVSVNTVKSKLRRARLQLGSALSEHYGRFVKSRNLEGGFLMQLMEQIRHIPSPTIGFTWGSTAVSKVLFSLITAMCVLIGIIGIGDSPNMSPNNQIGLSQSYKSRWPIEVKFFTPDHYTSRPTVSGIPSPAGKHPVGVSNRALTEQNRNSTGLGSNSGKLGARTATPQLPAVAAAKEEEIITYSGRVVDNDGAPVPDAKLQYAIESYPRGGDAESVYFTYPDRKYDTRTGKNGVFRFEISPTKRRSTHFNFKNTLNFLQIAVAHPDHAIWWKEYPFQSTADVEIELEAPKIITGKVMNEAGDPIKNAKVLIQSVFRGQGERGDRLSHFALPKRVKTDTNGEFVLPGLQQGTKISLDVQASGYAKEFRHSVPVSGKRLNFRLTREGRIEGRITYADTGKPVKSAMVSLQGIYPTVGAGQSPVRRGKYRLNYVAPGTYSLYLHQGPKGWTALPEEFITVTGGQTVTNVDFALIRSGFITGRVTDLDTNEPIAGHTIRLNDAVRPQGSQLGAHHIITDATGAYKFDAVPGEAVVHTNTPPGYQDIGWTERLDIGQVERRVEVVEGETVTVDFQFSKGIDLTGRLVDETGKPVAGAKISNDRMRLKKYGTSDGFGRFTVDGLRVGSNLGLRAVNSELGLRGTVEIEVQPDLPVEIRMKRQQRIAVSGRAIDGEGKPMPLANVHLIHWDHQRGIGADTIVDVTDDDGRFQNISLIVGDKYEIYVKLDGYRNAETDQFTATAVMTQIADFVLLPAGGQFFVEGRVIDDSGEPVSGVQLSINQAGQHWSSRTDENGYYRMEELSMAVISALYIFHPAYPDLEVRILKTNRRHDFELVMAIAYLAGKVVDAEGKPIEQARVMVGGEETPFSSYRYPVAYTNVYGDFELPNIKGPVVSMGVYHKRYRKTFKDIAVNQRDLVLTLTPSEHKPEPTQEQQLQRSYAASAEDRFNTLLNKTAPGLAVVDWLSGSPVSIGELEGKTIVLHFWDLKRSNHIQWIRLLNILHEVYGEKGLVCVAVCRAATEIEAVKRHITEQSLSCSIGLDRPATVDGAKGETFERYAVGWHPFILINAAGEIAGRSWEHDLEAKVQTLIVD